MIELTDWTGEFKWISTNWIGTCVQYQRSILYTKCCVIWHQEENNEKIICIDDVLKECSILIRIILMRNALWKCKPDYDNVGLSVKKVVNFFHPWWTNSWIFSPWGLLLDPDWFVVSRICEEFTPKLSPWIPGETFTGGCIVPTPISPPPWGCTCPLKCQGSL